MIFVAGVSLSPMQAKVPRVRVWFHEGRDAKAPPKLPKSQSHHGAKTADDFLQTPGDLA